MPAGSIVIDLLMRTGSFETDTDRAAKALEKFQRQAVAVGKAIGIGLAAGATAAAVAFDQLVRGAADFKDLEEITGTSAENIASFAVAVGTAGVGIDSFAGNVNKLTKNLTGVDDESKAAGAALAALGIPLKDFKTLDPTAQIDTLAKAFSEFADGPQKTAVALAIFGKSGAEMLKVFKALEEQGGRQTILTQEQIDLADEYADRQAKARAQLTLYAQAAATQALPAFNSLIDAGKDFIAELIGIDSQTGKLGANTAVKDFAEGAVRALGFVVDAADGVARTFNVVGKSIGGAAAAAVAVANGDFKQAARIIGETQADIESILSRETFSSRLEKALSANNAVTPKAKDTRPTIQFDGAVSKAKRGDDPTKKLLDNEVKLYQEAFERERDLFASRNRFLDLYNSQGVLSIRSYYDAQRTILEAATTSQAAQLDKQLEALRKFRDAPGRKETEKADADGKINELLSKRAKLTEEANEKAVELSIREQQAQEQLQVQIQGLNASVLELTGNLGEAAAIRFDTQNAQLQKQLIAEGNDEALKLLATLRQQTIAQADFQKQSNSSQEVLARLRNTEDSIAIARQLGATGELESLSQLGAARAQAVQQLEAIVVAQEAVARASGNPQLIQNAEAARAELERLRATADPLADKFRTLFEDSFSNSFVDFISGTKSAKDAFKDFANSIINELVRIAAQDFARSIFGAGGSGGGIVSFFSSIFGGAKAGGGDVIGGRAYLVGENGPEMFVPRTVGSILPADQTAAMGRGTTVNAPITVQVSGAVDRRTREQIGADVHRYVGIAVARGTA